MLQCLIHMMDGITFERVGQAEFDQSQAEDLRRIEYKTLLLTFKSFYGTL